MGTEIEREPPRVFISYSHDSDAHRARVLELAQRLRTDGIDAEIDRFVRGAPAKGWPLWMLDELEAARFVLVVCTETYYRRFRGREEPGRGAGVVWEGAIISNELYGKHSATTKFVPVVFESGDEEHVPEPIRGYTRYTPTEDESYERLVAFLFDEAGVEPAPVGRKRRPGATKLPDPMTAGTRAGHDVPFELPLRALSGHLVGRRALVAELAARLRSGDDVCVWGPAGAGKTALAAEAIAQILEGRGAEQLPRTRWPHGIVLLDLYRLKADSHELAWSHLLSPALFHRLPSMLCREATGAISRFA